VFRTNPSAAVPRNIGMPESPDGYAAALYSTLHDLDCESWDWIAVERPPDAPEWAAILDRLRRACQR